MSEAPETALADAAQIMAGLSREVIELRATIRGLEAENARLREELDLQRKALVQANVSFDQLASGPAR